MFIIHRSHKGLYPKYQKQTNKQNKNRKWAKALDSHLSKEDMSAANKCTDWASESLVIREIQIMQIMPYAQGDAILHSLEWLQLKILSKSNISEDMELTHTLVQSENTKN